MLKLTFSFLVKLYHLKWMLFEWFSFALSYCYTPKSLFLVCILKLWADIYLCPNVSTFRNTWASKLFSYKDSSRLTHHFPLSVATNNSNLLNFYTSENSISRSTEQSAKLKISRIVTDSSPLSVLNVRQWCQTLLYLPTAVKDNCVLSVCEPPYNLVVNMFLLLLRVFIHFSWND